MNKPKFNPADFKPLSFYTGPKLLVDFLTEPRVMDLRYTNAINDVTDEDRLYTQLVIAFLRNYDRLCDAVCDEENPYYQEAIELSKKYRAYVKDLIHNQKVTREELNEAIAKMREYLFKQ